MRNLTLAFRTLFRSPFVTGVAIVSLAFGIGANTAIFSIFDRVLLRPLPVQEPDRLVNLSAPGEKWGSVGSTDQGSSDEVFSYPMFRDLERGLTTAGAAGGSERTASTGVASTGAASAGTGSSGAVFTGIAAHRRIGVNLASHGQTSTAEGMLVSGSYFSVLGLRPALGRLLDASDDRRVGESPVVVLSHPYWQTRFASNPSVLNDTLIVNGQPMTIVGVAPRGFGGTSLSSLPSVFVPITMRGLLTPGFNGFENRRNYWAYLFARLAPGVSVEGARSASNGLYQPILADVEAPLQHDMSAETLAKFKAKSIGIVPGARGQSLVQREAGASLTLLLAVTGFVLLIACANIANLLLARAANRTSEMAVRLSIGASRRHLIVQLLTESCLLAAIGGAAGLLVAAWTLQLMAALLPAEIGGGLELQIETPALLFTAALTLGTGLLFGLFPALHSTRPDLLSTLKGFSGQPAGARSAARFRTTLAVVQIALSMMLLVSAGLFARSLANISRVELGITIDHLLTFNVAPNLNGYSLERSQAFFTRLEQELAALPGVRSVTASRTALLNGDSWGDGLLVEGFPVTPDTDTDVRSNEIGPGYFRTMGVPLLAGRELSDADVSGAHKVAIVNEAFAKMFNLGRDVVGKRIGLRGGVSGGAGGGQLDTEIVGFVRDMKYSSVKEDMVPLVFWAYRQSTRRGGLNFYVRTTGEPAQVMGTVRKTVARLDPNLPIDGLKTLEDQFRESVFTDRFISMLVTTFAGLATLLAAVGLYGVLAYTVSQRTREIGLRMALGAAPEQVRGMVLRQVGVMVIAGGAIGLAAAIVLGRAAQAMLYRLDGHDPMVLVSAAVLLTLVAMSAGFVPAHRASRIDPMKALRSE